MYSFIKQTVYLPCPAYEAIGQAQVNKEAIIHTVLDLREPISSVRKNHNQLLG